MLGLLVSENERVEREKRIARGVGGPGERKYREPRIPPANSILLAPTAPR